MASALATPHTATRPSSLSSSFGLSSSLSFIFMLLFWLFWLFWHRHRRLQLPKVQLQDPTGSSITASEPTTAPRAELDVYLA